MPCDTSDLVYNLCLAYRIKMVIFTTNKMQNISHERLALVTTGVRSKGTLQSLKKNKKRSDTDSITMMGSLSGPLLIIIR